ncbi:MAG: hypothetical protein K2K70_03195 [Lachnospiraceae bacterium]|nr:hypothetical protein [Lachnospiraceae bacterium]
MKWLEKIQKSLSDVNYVKHVIGNFMEVIKKMSTQSEELNSVLEVLKLDGFDGKYDDNDIKGAITLLKHYDEIWDGIRKNYLKKIISCDGYKLNACDIKEQKDDECGISHILMRVEKGADTIAWICVDTNLYIVTKKKTNECTKEGAKYENGWTEYNNDYRWKYIDYPNNSGKHIKLNVPTQLPEIKENEIKLEQLLSD